MALRSPAINVMIRAAEKAAKGLRRDFGEVEQLQVSRKGPADFVSAADLKADRTLREELSRARPDYGLVTEEHPESPAADGRHRWIVDPLDGTTNFLHGIPHWAISI
jgi:myo-inositol-1(or 4)-monophosphatase